MKIGIVADDFTGANDVALQLIKYGIRVKSFVDVNEIEGNFIYTTETRNSTEEDSRKKLEEFFAKTKEEKVDKVYKKIDSTLRGNIKTEIEVFLENIEVNEKIAVIVSFPRIERIVKNGKLYVKGELLENTDFARDPYWTLTSSDILDYFPGKLINLNEIRGENFYESLKKHEENLLVFEAETEKDLELIAENLVKSGYDKYITASSGIMEQLLKYWGYKKEKMLLVAGSCNPINIKQIADFIEEFKPTVYDYYIDENRVDFIEGNEEVLILRTIRDDKKSQKTREELNSLISDLIKKIVDEKEIKKVALSGGDISLSFMEKFSLKNIEILSEIEPGIAFGIAKDFKIITKPGGFGGEKIYKNIYSFFKTYR